MTAPFAAADFPHGGGATGAMVRALDWARTPLGPIASWPASLRTTVETMLGSRHPMFLWWGRELIQIYNDAYVPSFGVGKHPAALGQRGRDCWAEIWPIIGPQIERVMSDAMPTWHEDALVPIARNGRLEEVYWTYGYSPVFLEDRSVGGTLVVCHETTRRVLAARRQRLLVAITERTSVLHAERELMPAVLAALAELPEDVPFVEYHAPGARTALAAARVVPVTGRGPVTAGYEVPLGALGTLAVGLSARLPFDAPYREFLDNIARAIAHARDRIATRLVRSTADAERRDLLMQAPVATSLVIGPEHRYELANARYIAMVGREVVGKTFREAFPEAANGPLPAILDRVYRTGEPFVANEMHVPLVQDGALVDTWFKFNLVAVRDADGAVYGMMVVALDITEVVRARDELVAANRTKDDFLAMLGHELRNPLAPIVTALDLAEQRDRDATRTREHQLIRRQVAHLTRLVDDLLDVSKITRGKVELRREQVELADVVAKAIELADAMLEARAHHLHVDLPAAPVRWWADPVRLAQVLANLLTNAARYTPDGGNIWLTAGVDAGGVVVRVRDDGSGIAPELLPNIFDLFVQGHRSADRAEGGLGLGLTLVRTLVALHGGSVAATSAGRDAGSEFVVRLPLTAAPVDGASAVAAPARPIAGKRVLVVDDNVDAADMLAELLRARGHDVAVAHDGLAALELVPTFDPEVAILDIGLPLLDGYELAGRVARANAACRLVAVTGYGQPSDRTRTREAGFHAHLVKPVSIAALLGALTA